jgi:hypothetical protein
VNKKDSTYGAALLVQGLSCWRGCQAGYCLSSEAELPSSTACLRAHWFYFPPCSVFLAVREGRYIPSHDTDMCRLSYHGLGEMGVNVRRSCYKVFLHYLQTTTKVLEANSTTVSEPSSLTFDLPLATTAACIRAFRSFSWGRHFREIPAAKDKEN